MFERIKNWALGKPKTSGYRHVPQASWGQRPRDLPPFTFDTVRAMLRDPTIRLGLKMRLAPIAASEWAYKDGEEWVSGIKADRPEVGEFVQEQIQRIWRHDLHKIAKAQVWGWSAGEVLYRAKGGRIEYDCILDRHAMDVRALERRSELVGTRFNRIRGSSTGYVDLLCPKSFWHVFDAEAESKYGYGILYGAYSPWADKFLEGGALDVRRLFMHKDAYGGVDMTYPDGTTTIDDGSSEGQQIPNRDIARQIAEQIKAGGVTTRPAEYDANGNQLWELTRAQVPSNPQHILQYPQDLDVEILRGMEIPDDVLTSDETGAWAGKAVPQQAFYTGLEEWRNKMIQVVVVQILEHLVLWNFGRAEEFEVTAKPMAEQAQEQSTKNAPGQDVQPGASMLSPPQPPRQMALNGHAKDTAALLVGSSLLGASEVVQSARELLRKRGIETDN